MWHLRTCRSYLDLGHVSLPRWCPLVGPVPVGQLVKAEYYSVRTATAHCLSWLQGERTPHRSVASDPHSQKRTAIVAASWMAVKRSEGEWVNGRNQVLHTLTYRPAADPTACLMFHHG